MMDLRHCHYCGESVLGHLNMHYTHVARTAANGFLIDSSSRAPDITHYYVATTAESSARKEERMAVQVGESDT